MVQVRQRLLIAAVLSGLLLPVIASAQKFYSDDPIQVMPAPLPVKDIKNRKIDVLADFLFNSADSSLRPSVPAGEINTLGEVPNSDWFTNRHATHRLTRDELRRGAGTDHEPQPPFTIIGGKTEGITPGFRMRDRAGRMYFVKPDPMSNPEMATASDLIVSRFFWAVGYNTPENYIIYPHASDLVLAEDATIAKLDGNDRVMTWNDVEAILENIPHSADGSFRVLASLAAAGQPIGPFRYEGTRSDDPNDIVPHENRRDLRGLFVIASWLNHTDAKSGNSLDTVVEENGVHFVRHYLLDFGAALGSDSDRPKDARIGHAFMLPRPGEAVAKIFGLD